MSRYKTKEGRPLCRYCLKLLAEDKHVIDVVNVSKVGGKDLRNVYAPSGTYGRNGKGLFCTMRCAEEWANRKLTGLSVPRGKSHDYVPAPRVPLYDTPHDRAIAEAFGEEVLPLPEKEGS